MTTKNKNDRFIIRILLHNIRSVYNVGAIFRTADAIGVDKIYLSGYSPTPKDRFGQLRKDFAKSALGSENNIEWEQIDNYQEIIDKLKKENFKIISVEQSEKSVDYKKINLEKKDKILMIFGNETNGVSKDVLDQSDIIAEIPMRGIKESLNVSVSSGIILFRLFDN